MSLNDMTFADEVRVKDELEVGPTLLQPRTNEAPTYVVINDVDWSEGFDPSKPISSKIIFEDDSDVDAEDETSKELLTAECDPMKISSENECLGDVAGSQDTRCASEKATPQTTIITGDGTVTCAICSAQFESLSTLEIHNQQAHYNSLNNFEEIHCVEAVTCEICGLKFSKYNIKSHKRLHTGELPFVCVICNAVFPDEEPLKTHTRIHTGERRFQCELCNAKFMTAPHLKTHESSVHSGKFYICKICQMEFKRKHLLKKHKESHSGHRSYKCDVCSAKFTRLLFLKNHARTHTGELEHKCDICNAQFKHLNRLKCHTRAQHTGETPFKCDLCNATFVQSLHLSIHTRTHTGGRPFKCERCKATFSQERYLMEHIEKDTCVALWSTPGLVLPRYSSTQK